MDNYLMHPIDLEWHRLLQRYGLETQYFLNVKRMAAKEIPKVVADTDITKYHTDIEKNQRFLIEALNFVNLQAEPPKPIILFLLRFANVLASDESHFIKLHSKKIFEQLIFVSQPTALNTNDDIKFIFLNLLNSFIRHPSGVKWITETNYYVDVYTIILQYQRKSNKRFLEPGHLFLTRLLEKTVKENKTFCIAFLKFLSGPILLTVQELKMPSSKILTSYGQNIYHDMNYHGTCLVVILERLLNTQSSQVLNFLLKLKVREAADNIALVSSDPDFSITMYRILIILSLYEINELFDGIKVIQQNILALTGIHRIVEREIEKGNMFVVLEICHYAIKYSKTDGFNLPKHVIKDRLADIESEYILLQLLPSFLIIVYIGGTAPWNEDNLKNFKSLIRFDSGIEMIKYCSVKTMYCGYELRNKIISKGSVEVYLQSLDLVVKTKSNYSRKNLNRITMFMVTTLEDLYNHFNKEIKCRILKYEEQLLVEKLIEVIVDIMETPNLSLDDKLKCIDIPTFIHHFLYTINWPSSVVIKGLRLLKLLIVKHMSPNMLLLIDSIKGSAIEDIGHMLFVKLFSSDWEVRQVALNVINTIAHTANTSFSSFKEILVNASLPEVILVLCVEDENPLVRAAAFKCLQEIFIISGIEDNLQLDEIADQVLASIHTETDSLAKREAVKLISVIYWHNKDTEHYKYLTQIYACLEQVAYKDHNYLVQQEIIYFWKVVESKHMRSAGWIDSSFPPVIFSKKIIRMTNEEVVKRIFQVLDNLSSIGCLNIIKHFCECNELSEEVSTLLDDWLHGFYEIYHRYEVTETSLALYEDPLIHNSSVQKAVAMSDVLIENIDEWCPQDYMVLTSNESNLPQNSIQARMRPSEFVHLIYFMKDRNHKDVMDDINETCNDFNNYALEY